MAKIELDKYYTPDDLAQYCIDKTRQVLRGEKVTDIIEPSAGAGAFTKLLPKHLTTSYDIEPESEDVNQQDYLSLDLSYQKGRLVIGNPPFGDKMNLAQKFFKKSVGLSDFISFILPISQLQNTNSLYEFDLIHSEDLGKKDYSGVKLHCCLNIYKRNINGLNIKPINKLKNVEIIRQDSKRYNEILCYDLRMCYWGNGSAGKILENGDNYSAEYKLLIKEPFKDRVKTILKNINWFDELNCIAMLKIQQFHIVSVLKKYIPELN